MNIIKKNFIRSQQLSPRRAGACSRRFFTSYTRSIYRPIGARYRFCGYARNAVRPYIQTNRTPIQ